MARVVSIVLGGCIVIGVGNLTQSKGWMAVATFACLFVSWAGRDRNTWK